MKDRATLDKEIDELGEWMPQMIAETDAATVMDAFAGCAELIRDQAGADDSAYVHDRLQSILVENCLIPTDEGPCA